MRLRNKLAERARPYLDPGEQIQAVFGAQSGLSPSWQCLPSVIPLFTFPWWSALDPTRVTVVGGVGALWIVFNIVFRVLFRPHHVVVTDRAIVVLDVNRWTNRPTRLRLRHSRNFYFGQLSGFWGKFVLDNTKYWVQRGFHGDVAAADAALTEMMQRQQPGPAAAAPVGQQPQSLPPGWP